MSFAREYALRGFFGGKGESGGGGSGETVPEWMQYISTFGLDKETPEKLTITAPPLAIKFSSAIRENKALKELYLTVTNSRNGALSMDYLCYMCSSLEYVKIVGDLSNMGTFLGAFAYDNKLKIIDALIPFEKHFLSASGSYNPFESCGSLEEVRFIPNSSPGTVGATYYFNKSNVFSNETLVSLANAMKAEAKATITLGETPKAKCTTIMGTVSNNGEYDLFTADAAGDTTLTEFITNVKGWTLA